MTRTEISRELFGKNVPASELSRAFAVLEKAKLAECKVEKGRGPPKETWYAI